MSISVNNLSKHYGSQKAVNQISFTINKGEVVGFLGPNGAGKSTTMKIITGYLEADNGSVEVCGLTVADNNIQAKKKIGYLPEANPLYSYMYVREYLGFIAGIHKIPVAEQRIEEVIKLVGLTPEANKRTGQLSKGYKQRVGLAAALLHDPEVLILDEPTSGLDPNQIVEIRELIRSLGKNKTVLFSSHIMQEVEAVCDRVIIINKGNIVADDKLESLRRSFAESQFITVGFKNDVNVYLLQKLRGVLKISPLRQSTFNIECENADDLKKDLFQLSIQHGLTIISLQTETPDLESVFKTLTA